VRDRAQGELLKSHVSGYRFTYGYYNYKNMGPLAGILSGLSACQGEYCFVAACDMPFINEKIVKLLFRKSNTFDAAIPRWEDGSLEPLHAVYRCKSMIRETEKALENNETIILAPIFRLKAHYVEVDEIRRIDPDLRTFMNVNTCEDIQKVIDES